jgi:hypothetical protein
MLAASLTSLVLLLSHLSGSSAKYVDFGSGTHARLLAHRPLRRQVASSPAAPDNASDTTAAAASGDSTPAAASAASDDVQTNDGWDGSIDLSAPPPSDLTESDADKADDEGFCSVTKVCLCLVLLRYLRATPQCYVWGPLLVVFAGGIALWVYRART